MNFSYHNLLIIMFIKLRSNKVKKIEKIIFFEIKIKN